MVRLLAILGIGACLFLLFSMPWLSAVAYSFVSVLQPQYIWFWSFEGIPIFKVTAGLTLIAWLIQAMKKEILWNVYKTGQTKIVVFIWFMMHVSNFFTPFTDYFSGVSSDIVLGTMNTIVIMYLAVIGLLNNEKALNYLSYALVFIGIYYAYWANDHYFSNNWAQFTNGRLNGPSGSPYRDGNATSIVLIVCMPFVLFGIQHFKQKWVKILLLLTIPLMWHALILFASRGALLSAGALTLFAATIIKSKTFNKLLLLGFAVIIIDQGGTLLQRTTSTVDMARSGSEEPLNPRLVSWDVGLQLIAKYPIFGVGPERFQIASATHFPGKSPHVAHNTFLNFSVNNGLMTGIAFLLLFWVSFKQYKKIKILAPPDSTYSFINNACAAALLGFFIGAIFLDLIIFEPFYCILLLLSANYCLCINNNQGSFENDKI